jgi:hypothetical protein
MVTIDELVPQSAYQIAETEVARRKESERLRVLDERLSQRVEPVREEIYSEVCDAIAMANHKLAFIQASKARR